MKNRLLYINIGFYNYEDKIIRAIQKQGFEVDSFYDKPLINQKTLFLKRISHNSTTNYFENEEYQLCFLNQLPKDLKYDVILVVVGRCLSAKFLEKLRNEHCAGKMVLYLWDDIKRVENYEKCHIFYDNIFSFDRADCSERGIKFLPLFYANDFTYNGEKKNYDICSIGAGHSGRYEIIESILRQVGKLNLNNYIYLYMGTFTNIKRMIKNHSFYTPTYIHNTFLPFEDTVIAMKRSKYVLDVQYKGQRGLTIRTFEAIGSRAKIITTNDEIVNYDFYNPQNVYVIDREKPKIDLSFFETPYIDPGREIVDKYSIDSWIESLVTE